LRNLSKAKEREQQEREEKAFRVPARLAGARYPDGTTQVSEFRLSKGKSGVRDRLKKEREDKIKMECTFRPDTVEGRNRKVLEGILNDEFVEGGGRRTGGGGQHVRDGWAVDLNS